MPAWVMSNQIAILAPRTSCEMVAPGEDASIVTVPDAAGCPKPETDEAEAPPAPIEGTATRGPPHAVRTKIASPARIAKRLIDSASVAVRVRSVANNTGRR